MKNSCNLIYLVFIFYISCNDSSIDKHILYNTKWQYNITDTFTNTYFFIDSLNYEHYDAELGEHFYGIYKISGDTIILNQNKGEYENEYKEDSTKENSKETYYMLLINNELGNINMRSNSEWVDDFYYTKVEN